MTNRLHSNNSEKNRFYKIVIPKLYGIGASVVIVGAMFKLLNWPGGNIMLGLGLTTEAIIFFLSAFEPQEKEIDWTKAYPELAEDYTNITRSHTDDAIGKKLDDMLSQAKIDATLLDRLGKGIQHLADSVVQIATLSNASVATEKYTTNIEKASEVLERIHHTHVDVLNLIQSISNASQSTAAYHAQVKAMTESLHALNEVYTQELQDNQLRSQTTHEVYTNLSESMHNMQAASDEAEKFKTELSKLNEKMAALNTVYGNMLTALKN